MANKENPSKPLGYKIEIESVMAEPKRRGEVHLHAHPLEIFEQKGEEKLVRLSKQTEYQINWRTKGAIRIEPYGEHAERVSVRLEPYSDDETHLWAELLLEGELPDHAAASSPHLSLEQLRNMEGDDDAPPRPFLASPALRVQLTRTQQGSTRDLVLWAAIRYSTERIKFPNYVRFLDYVLCGDDDAVYGDPHFTGDDTAVSPDRERMYSAPRQAFEKRKHWNRLMSGTDGYRALREATDWFLKMHVGVHPTPSEFAQIQADLAAGVGAVLESSDGHVAKTFEAAWHAYTVKTHHARMLPYMKIIRDKLRDVPIGREHDDAVIECTGLLREKLQRPCLIELIWSYWQEEGMLVQSINAIAQRFQNRRLGSHRDPLANLEIDPLRPLNNLLWGYVQDELGRLSVLRRAHEYEHQYGLRLEGRAVAHVRPADRRSRFIEAFHNFLQRCHQFFQQDDDTTVHADGFPVLNAIKEVHYLLAAGAHNQFGDLPSTARAEMLIQQWFLGRPEMREFLGGRVMVPYPEPWMDRVDAMKALQGWTDPSAVHFNDLATFGEQIVLGLRYGGWSLTKEPASAAIFVRHLRPEIQGYLHAYQAVTGVDISAGVTSQRAAAERDLPPSVHLMRRLAAAKHT